MDVNLTVAENVKRIREDNKLSLDALAKLSGVSKSMLGQIERGEVNPTISVLWKIANGLKVSFTSLVEQHGCSIDLVRGGDIHPLKEDEGRYINYPVFSFDECFEQYRIEIQPNGSLDAAPHLPNSQENITVFAGTVEITVNQSKYILKQWDSLRFPADVPHGYRNAGSGTVQMSMLIYYRK